MRARTPIRLLGGLLLAAASACGADGGGGRMPLALADLCPALYAAGCDYAMRCTPGAVPAERAACVATFEDAWDGCPLAQDAVTRGEADYDAEAARSLVDALAGGACDSGPLPLFGGDDYPVFSPRLAAGDTCHSDVSCPPEHTCDDITVEAPEGVCRASTGS